MMESYHTTDGAKPRQRGRPRLDEQTVVLEAPPVIINSRVLPHVCPLCGKAQQPLVLQRTSSHVKVRCTSCAGTYQYLPSVDGSTPRVRLTLCKD